MGLLNKKATREYVLQQSRIKRNGKFTRVGETFFLRLEYALMKVIDREIHKHPSIGKTLK